MEQDWFNFFNSMIGIDAEADIINKYINGLIDKDEYIRRMDEYRRNKVR